MNVSRKSVKNLFVRRRKPFSFALFFASVAVITLAVVKAAPFVRSFEAESASRTGNARVVTNTGASGGSVLQFRAPDSGDSPIIEGTRCILYLVGAGSWAGIGSQNWSEGVLLTSPDKPASENRNFWKYDGPHNFAYDPGSQSDNQAYEALVDYIRSYLDNEGCGPTVVAGGSNGAAFAAKMYCRGEDFGRRVWGYHIDDPVMDNGVLGCSPSTNVTKVMFLHSQELRDDAANMPNFRCGQGQWQWYCEDDTTMPLNVYEGHVGQQSILQRRYHYCNPENDPCPGNFQYNQYDLWGGVGRSWWCEWYTIHMPESAPPACG